MIEPTAAERLPLDRRVVAILLSWGLAVLLIAGLGSFWIWHYQREQDRAMCQMLQLFVTGPEPVAGPAGDRGRTIQKAMIEYQKVLGCQSLLPRLPTAPR